MSTVVATTAPDSAGDDGHRVVVRWRHPDGHAVTADQVICDMDADGHPSVEVTTPEAGILRHRVLDGGTFVVGDELFRIDPAP